MKKKHLLLVMMMIVIQSSVSQEKSTKESLDWKLGVQSYTFKNFSFTESLDKINELNLGYVEAYPGQVIGNGIEGTMHYSMDEKTRKEVKKLLKTKSIELVAYGVVSGKNKTDWESLLNFAQDMGIKVITSEPKLKDLDMINKLAGKYGVKIALHNHPKPSIYWNPDLVLSVVKGRENIKACADVGHWVRSGLDPLESLKKLEGNIVSLHFKDLNEKSNDAHDVIWGTGISNVKSMLEELKRQNFEGIFSVEYEYNWDNSIPEIRKSVEFFKKTIEDF